MNVFIYFSSSARYVRNENAYSSVSSPSESKMPSGSSEIRLLPRSLYRFRSVAIHLY